MTLYALSLAPCPAGWTAYSVTDQHRYIYVTNATLGTTAGALTKSHTHNLPDDGTSYSNITTGLSIAPQNITATTLDIYPQGTSYLACEVPVASVAGYPSGAILLSDDTSCPAGWTAYAAGNSNYIIPTSVDADAGSTVAVNLGSHTHTVPCTSRRRAGATAAACGTTSAATVIDAATDLYHIKLMLCKKT